MLNWLVSREKGFQKQGRLSGAKTRGYAKSETCQVQGDENSLRQGSPIDNAKSTDMNRMAQPQCPQALRFWPKGPVTSGGTSLIAIPMLTIAHTTQNPKASRTSAHSDMAKPAEHAGDIGIHCSFAAAACVQQSSLLHVSSLRFHAVIHCSKVSRSIQCDCGCLLYHRRLPTLSWNTPGSKKSTARHSRNHSTILVIILAKARQTSLANVFQKVLQSCHLHNQQQRILCVTMSATNLN